MTTSSCAHERDVLDLVAIGQWPARADQSLIDHVTTCGSCAEVASVASAVREWADEGPAAKVPDASVVWYRAQVRAREEAARRASRPVLVVQIMAMVTVVLALSYVGPGWQWFAAMVPDVSMPSLGVDGAAWRASLDALSRWSWLGWATLAAVATWLIVGSIAWAATGKD